MKELVVAPVLPGTLLRMFPERQGDDVFLTKKSVFGKEIPFEGHPVFEVNTYVLDREGGHVTFYQGGFGTFYMLGGGTIVPVKFPYPHPMFEIVGEVETAQIRAGWTAHYVMEREKRRSRRWNRIIDSILQPKWLTKKLDALLA